VVKQIIHKYDWLFVFGLFLIVEVILNPIGEFPLNDDWAYSKTIYDYLNTGIIKFSYWQGFPDLPRFLISASICKVFGFSFTVLRFITLATFTAAFYVFYRNLKLLEFTSSIRLPLLFLFTFNPLTVYLSNTYLSDIFQLLLTLISFQFIVLYFKSRQLNYLIIFTIISCLATLNRQISLTVPLIYTFVYYFNTEKDKRNIVIGLMPFISNCILLWMYEFFAKSNQLLPGNYYLQLNNILSIVTHPSLRTLKKIAYYFITSTICLGLFFLPLTISNFQIHLKQLKQSRFYIMSFCIYLFIVLLKLILSKNPLPFVGNIFYHCGVGPVILTGYNTDEIIPLSSLVKNFYICLNIIGGISFISALLTVILKHRHTNNNVTKVALSFFILLLLIYLIPLCFGYANDRYLLLLIPFFYLAYALSLESNLVSKLFWITLLPLIYFSFASNYNYISINRAKASAANHLLNELNIKPNQIDGGFEFNGWHLAESGKNYFPDHVGRWWWIDKDDYIISTVNRNNYTIESEYSFSTLPPYTYNKIFVLKKDSIN